MSRASKLTLAATSVGALGILISVHYAQKAEQAVREPISSSSFVHPVYQNHVSADQTDFIASTRLCMRESFEMWSSKESRRSVRPTLTCSGVWRMSIAKRSMCMMAGMLAMG